MIQIIVVHPSRLVCNLYAAVLDENPDLHVVGQATSIKETLTAVQKSSCNIVLVSAALPDHGALELTRHLSQDFPHVKVLVVGLPESKYVILQYVMAGASGYVLQDVTVDNLINQIEAVQHDSALISPAMASAFMEHIAELAQLSSHPYLQPEAYNELTPREVEVLELIDKGSTNQEIADALVIEVGTVKNHVHSILKKLDESNREDAAAHLPYIHNESADSL